MIEGVSRRLRGKYDHKLDSKNRVAIPAKWEPREGGTLSLLPTDRKGFPCIKALTEDKLEEIENKINNDPDMSEKQKNYFLEWVYGSCEEVSVNNQNKLLIPKKMYDEAQLDSDVVLIGRGNFFEIWEPSTYEKMNAVSQPEIKQLRDIHGII